MTRYHGEEHPTAKLSDTDAEAIITRYALGGISQRELADEFGIHQSLVSLMTRGLRRA